MEKDTTPNNANLLTLEDVYELCTSFSDITCCVLRLFFFWDIVFTIEEFGSQHPKSSGNGTQGPVYAS